MKTFFAAMFGTMVGLACFLAGGVVLVIGLVAVIGGQGDKPVAVEAGSYVVVDLTGVNLTDQPPEVEAAWMNLVLRGDRPEAMSLRMVTEGLRRAREDGRIRGVFLTGQLSPDGFGSGLGALREFRAGLAEVAAAGKPVKAFFEGMSLAEVYLGSVASEVSVDPFGLVFMPGLSARPMFFSAALERFGVGVQVTRSGKYKSAIEPFIRQDLSAENREQLQGLLDDLWAEVMGELGRARRVEEEGLQAAVDREGLFSAELAVAAGLADRVAYRDEVLAELQAETGKSGLEAFAQIDLRDYVKTEGAKAGAKRGGLVAVVYAEGVIVDGEGTVDEVGGARFARQLRMLRQDPEVAAVVLRVNSPGGSASASEQILREATLLARAKPLVTSFGSYAASGGYWIAMSGGPVLTEAATITGSIGVYGMQVDIEVLAANLGVAWDGVKTGRHADAFTVTRPKTEEEMAIFQRMVDRTYGAFLERVAKARGLAEVDVDGLAQGRVWSGAEAVKRGLADEVGGLEDAIRRAAREADLGEDYAVEEYPFTRSLADALADWFADRRAPVVTGGALARLKAEAGRQLEAMERFNDPHGIYARLPLEVRLR